MSHERTAAELRLALTRRAFALSGAAALALLGARSALACQLPITGAPWPSRDGWEHRTIAHFLNALYPGTDGAPLFAGDDAPLQSQGDASPGAWSACVLPILYDPFYGAEASLGTLAAALDWSVRLQGRGMFFYKASPADQLAAIDGLTQGLLGGFGGKGIVGLALAAALGAFTNDTVTKDLGWPGPNGGHFDQSRHPTSQWRQPTRLTTDGNLP